MAVWDDLTAMNVGDAIKAEWLDALRAFAQSGVVQLHAVAAERRAGDIVGDDDIVFDTEISDADSAYNNSTGVWTCPVDGLYHIRVWIGQCDVIGGYDGNNYHASATLYIKKASAVVATAVLYAFSAEEVTVRAPLIAEVTLDLELGDTIHASIDESLGGTLKSITVHAAAAGECSLLIHRVG
jgi:hypothetical protein